MSKYLNAPPSRSDESSFDRPGIPEHCGVDGCLEPCHVLTVVVRKAEGGTIAGAWSDFARDNRSLRDGYSFVRWIPRCGDHYIKELYGCGKGALSPICGRDPYVTHDALMAYWQKIDAEAA